MAYKNRDRQTDKERVSEKHTEGERQIDRRDNGRKRLRVNEIIEGGGERRG